MLPAATIISTYHLDNFPDLFLGNKDYGILLRQWKAECTPIGNYLRVGDPPLGQGWILDATATESNISILIRTLVPILLTEKVSFRIVNNEETAKATLLGVLGYLELGKVISIFPDTTEKAVSLATTLIRETASLKGPSIPTDYHLGGTVYTRYGGFVSGYSTNEQGISERVYIDMTGQIAYDNISIPFQLGDQEWPFGSIKPYGPVKDEKVIAGKYKIERVLKNDVKGRVLVVTPVEKAFRKKLYVIKEGISNMASDAYDRDIQDKLAWQYSVSKQLEGLLPIPKAIELLRVENTLYFVMEFIPGVDLGEAIDTRGSMHWAAYEENTRQEFGKDLLFVLEFLEKMHENGFYHRDISSRNFKRSGDQCYGIDLELAYKYKEGIPNPPYVVGPPGYMSPEQRRIELPTAAQEVYSVGCLALRTFTGLSPRIFHTDDNEVLYSHLKWLIGDDSIAKLICSCLVSTPAERPTLGVVKEFFTNHFNKGNTGRQSILTDCTPNPNEVRRIVERGILGLAGDSLAGEEGLWYTSQSFHSNYVNNENLEKTILLGLSKGIAGVLYFLASAQLAGYDTSICKEKRIANWKYLDRKRFVDGEVTPGLFYGSPGAVLAFAKGVSAGKITLIDEIKPVLETSMAIETEDLTLSTGLAGHGIALLHSAETLQLSRTHDLTERIVEKIIKKQQKDGSWYIFKSGFDKPYKLSGFSHGTAGIVFYLLEVYKKNGKKETLDAALWGLKFLEKKCYQVINGDPVWKMYPDGPRTAPWLDSGATGNILPFIRAYDITSNAKYRAIAEKSLRHHRANLVTPYLSVLTGATGIGEVYLEAWKTFGTDEWRNRAGWIVQLLLHTYQSVNNKGIRWTTDNSSIPTADLLMGTTGIMHYLMRWLDTENIPMQIF